MNWYKKTGATNDWQYDATFIVENILATYPNATRAIVKVLDGPHANEEGDVGVQAVVEKGKTYRGHFDSLYLTVANASGKVTNVTPWDK